MSGNDTKKVGASDALAVQALDVHPWDWAEIYWSTADQNDWAMGKYTCPILEEYKLDSVMAGVDALPAADQNKSIKELHAVQADKSGTVDVDLFGALVGRAKTFKERKGFICSAVHQWIIIEICPSASVGGIQDYPAIEVWGFLQPKEIGKKASMQENLGYVVDDVPKGGWFRASIVHVFEAGKSVSGYNPHLLREVEDKNNKKKIVQDFGPVAFRQVTDFPTTERQGKISKPRYIYKLEVKVTNREGEEDRDVKHKALLEYYKSKNLTEEQLAKVTRFETGSYLKIWVRNKKIGWNSKCAIADEDNETCMYAMQDVDGPKSSVAIDRSYKALTAMSDDAEDWRYKYQNHYFRPFSYRNHVWKRNRFSMDPQGRFDSKNWYHIGLWPEELIEQIERLEGTLLPDPTKNGAGSIVAVTIAYGFTLGLLYKAQQSLKKAPDTKKAADALDSLVAFADLPRLAAMFALYGFPDNDEEDWYKGSKKTFLAMANKLKEQLADPSGSKETDTARFLYHFYCLLHSVTLDALKGGVKLEDDYKKYLATGEDKKWKFKYLKDPTKIGKESTLFKQKVTLLKLTGEIEKQLGGGNFPMPYLFWLAWTVSAKASCSIGLDISANLLKNSNQLSLTLSAEGEAGLFFDIGAAWTLSQELEKQMLAERKTFSQNRREYSNVPVTDVRKNLLAVNTDGNLRVSKTGFQFADSLGKMFKYVDLQLGVGLKFEASGTLGIKIDLDKETLVKPTMDDDPSFTVTATIPIYGKLSVLTKDFKTASCDLLIFTKAALALMPTGLYLGREKVWDGLKNMRVGFNGATLSPLLLFDRKKTEYAIGEEVYTTISSRDALSKEEIEKSKKPGAKLPMPCSGFAINICTGAEGGGPARIELATKGVFSPAPAGEKLFKAQHVFCSSLVLSAEKISADKDYGFFVKNLLSKNKTATLSCIYAGDISQERYTGNEQATFLRPYVHTIKVTSNSKPITCKDTLVLNFMLANVRQEKLPLYCQVWEVDVAAGIVYQKRQLKNRYREKGSFVAVQTSVPWQYQTRINLEELLLEGNFIYEGKGYELCFSFSIDRAGDYTIAIKKEERLEQGKAALSAMTRVAIQ